MEYKVDPETGEVLEEFAIDNEEKLEWAMKKLFDWRMEQKAVEEKRKEINDNLDTMHNRIQNKIDKFIYFVGPMIEAYAKATMGDKRSVVTPYGKVQFRKIPATYKVVNEEAFKAWACANCPEAVEIVAKVYKSKVPEDMLDQADGVEYVPEREKVEI